MSSEKGIRFDGTPSEKERCSSPGMPSPRRLATGPVAVIECVEQIPCNPCEAACPTGAIIIGDAITNLPALNEEKCTGCGICIAACPGLSIFKLDLTYDDENAVVEFPYEYLPLPAKGMEVPVVDRFGEVVGKGVVMAVKQPPRADGTKVVAVKVAKSLADRVRGMKGEKLCRTKN